MTQFKVKKCNKCGLDKPHRWVLSKRYTLGGCYMSKCEDCQRAARRIRDRRRRQRYKAKYHDIKQQIITYLGGKCLDCNLIDEPAVYDCHHLESAKKDFNICAGAWRNYRTFNQLKPELDKCVLLCAVCHRKRHAKERRAVTVKQPPAP
jgi:hypothetical protein